MKHAFIEVIEVTLTMKNNTTSKLLLRHGINVSLYL